MSELTDKVTVAPDESAPDGSSRYWLSQIASAKKVYAPFYTRGDKVIHRYRDENTDREMIQGTRGRKMALLWSNVETIKPALYNQTPVPNVSRRNKDADPVGRVASEVLERCVAASLESQDFDKTMRDVVQDLLLPGMGIAIEEYGADISGGVIDDGDSEAQPERVENQRSTTRYLHWKDWLTNRARMWGEVWFFAYRSFLTREEVTERYGEEIGKAIQLDHKPEKTEGATTEIAGDYRATVWTIWSKRHGKVYQVAPGYPDENLSESEPPTKHEGFWPMPRPLQATVANDSIIPTPDFALYQDQADAIDLLTNKIYKLGESLRLRGLYPADMESVKRLLQDASDTEMIPVESWAMLAERGGANGIVVWFPLKEVAAALVACMEALEKQKSMLYEVTGMSDIIRGASDASETATAQQIKSQWGSLRVRDRQRDVARFARDIVRRKAEVIAQHFSLETLQQMSGMQLLTQAAKAAIQQQQATMANWQQIAQQAQQAGVPPPPPPQLPQPTPAMIKAMDEPTWDEVIALLRNDKARGFLIDVETDSTVEPDQMQEQQKATEFIGSVVQFLEASAKILPLEPMAAPMLGELLMFGVRRFKAGESMETAIEKFVERMEQQAAAPKPPDPRLQAEQVRAQAEIARAQADQKMSEMDVVAHQAKTQVDTKTADANIAFQQAELDRKKFVDQQTHERELLKIAMDAHHRHADRMASQQEAAINRADQQARDQADATDRQNADARSQESNAGLAAVGEGLREQGQAIQAGMVEMAKAFLSEQEIVRGPDGRVSGARRKPRQED